jgi:hypothetical protein
LQFGLSAAKETVQTAASRIENKIFVKLFISCNFPRSTPLSQ